MAVNVLRKPYNDKEDNCVVTFSVCFCQTTGVSRGFLWAGCLDRSRCSRFGTFHTVVLLSLISIMTVKHNIAFLLTCYFINYRIS